MQSVTTTHVDDLCDMLPMTIRKDWIKNYQTLSENDKIHPFAPFMKFLESERTIAMRLTECSSRKSDQGKSVKTFHASSQKANAENHNESDNTHAVQVSKTQTNTCTTDDSKTIVWQCIVHNKQWVKHKTANCWDFKELNIKQRLDLLKKSIACFRCFGLHHRANRKSEKILLKMWIGLSSCVVMSCCR